MYGSFTRPVPAGKSANCGPPAPARRPLGRGDGVRVCDSVSGLANNGDFLKDNSQLPDFLNAHPYVQSTMREDPVGFMQRVRGFEMNGTSYDNDAMNRAN